MIDNIWWYMIIDADRGWKRIKEDEGGEKIWNKIKGNKLYWTIMKKTGKD